MSTSLQVLLIEESEADEQLIVAALRRGGFDPVVDRVDTAAAFTAALARQPWNLILSDNSLRSFNSAAALRILIESGNDIPLVVLTNALDEDVAVAAMRLGAQDYVMKNNLTRLAPVIEREMREAEVRRQGRKAQEKIQHQAQYDFLTDLPNRTMFNDRLTLALAHAQRERKMLAVLFVDLDRFKTIIDTLGHAAGDQLLRAVAERLASCLGEGDTLGRLGGDEFVLLLPQIDKTDKAAKLAHSLLEVLKPAFNLQGQELHITTSIGISLYPYDGEDADTLLKNADTALYRAKEQGRNNYQLYTPAMNARAFERLALENSLRKALERDEFLVYYQPQMAMPQNNIVGTEALIRWQHRDLGLVYPSEFVPLAEETGLIVALGEWVLRTACAQARQWQRAGLQPIQVSVNLSSRQFQHQYLLETVARVLKETGLEPKYLELEITESIAMQNADFSIVLLKDLKNMGVNISLDDFGTGYSSLNYLKKFPIDRLKIDQSFVRDLTTDPNDAAIVNAIIVLAHSLKLQVVAEGVETAEQQAFLQERGCDFVQGYLYNCPLPAAHFQQLLTSRQPSVPQKPFVTPADF